MAKRFLVSAALIAVIFVALTGCGNHPPEIVSVTASPSTVAPGEEATLTCNANDADGDQLSYEWESVDEDTTYTEASFIWPAPEETGDYRFYVTVIDGLGGVAYDSTLIVPVGYVAIPAVKLFLLDVSTREVTLVWNRSDYPTWYEYKLYRSDEQENARVNGKVIASLRDTNYVDKGLDPGTDYYYVVATIDSSDNIAFSNEIKVTTENFYLVGTQSLGGGHGLRLANTANYIFCATREQSVKGFQIGSGGLTPGPLIPHPNDNYNAYAYDLAISGSLLHVAFGKEGYMCYLITNPLTPIDTIQVTIDVLTGSFTAEAISIFAEGNDVFIGCTDEATSTHTLTWIQVNLATGQGILKATDTLRDKPTDVHVDGNYVYVAVQNSGLEILRWNQAGDPITALSFVSITSTNTPANQVYVSPGYAYVAASSDYDSEGLVILDVSNKSSPYKASQWPRPDENIQTDSKGVYFSGGRAYIADGIYGLRVLKLEDYTAPKYVGTKKVGDKLMDVWVKSQGDVTQAILADWSDAIHMIEW